MWRGAKWFLAASLAVAAVCLVSQGAGASVVLTIEPSSSSYTPGGTIDFTVRLSGATSLAMYDMDIDIADATGGLPGGLAGGHFWLVDLLANTGDPQNPNDLNIAARPADANYVFGANIDATTRETKVLLGPKYGLTMTDYDDSSTGRNTDPDRRILGTFRVQTAAAFSGTLRLTFDTTALALHDPDGNSIAGFSAADFTGYNVEVAPEPATLGLVGLGCAAWVLRRRRERC